MTNDIEANSEPLVDVVDDVQDDDLEIIIDESEDSVEADEAADVDASAAEADDANSEESEAVADEAPVEVAESGVSDDDELAAFPPKVSDVIRKRVERERRKLEQVAQERDQIKNAAVQVAQLAKQREDEVLTLKKANAALQRQFTETLDYAYERDIVSKAAEVRKAREDGDYDAELKAQGDLDTLRFQLQQIRQIKTTLPDPEKIVVPPAQSAPQPVQQLQQPVAQARVTPPAAQAVKWFERNKTWFGSPKFAGHRAFALAEDARLVAEGYDKHSDEYYKELDRRIDAAFPTLRKKAKPSAAPVAPASSTPARNTSSKVVKITKSDMTNMRMFGLDPNNKEHLREYARSKRTA